MGNVQDASRGAHSGGNPTPVYPNIGDSLEHDYEILKPPGPSRPAPRPPPPVPQNSTNTLNLNFNNLDGVPFIVNPKFVNSATGGQFQFPVVKAKTMQQIMNEFDYPFTVERET